MPTESVVLVEPVALPRYRAPPLPERLLRIGLAEVKFTVPAVCVRLEVPIAPSLERFSTPLFTTELPVRALSTDSVRLPAPETASPEA